MKWGVNTVHARWRLRAFESSGRSRARSWGLRLDAVHRCVRSKPVHGSESDRAVGVCLFESVAQAPKRRDVSSGGTGLLRRGSPWLTRRQDARAKTRAEDAVACRARERAWCLERLDATHHFNERIDIGSVMVHAEPHPQSVVACIDAHARICQLAYCARGIWHREA